MFNRADDKYYITVMLNKLIHKLLWKVTLIRPIRHNLFSNEMEGDIQMHMNPYK